MPALLLAPDLLFWEAVNWKSIIMRARAAAHSGILLALAGGACSVLGRDIADAMAAPQLRALSRQLRVDLIWDQSESAASGELERSTNRGGPFAPLRAGVGMVNVYCDFLGQVGGGYFYKARRIPAKGGTGSEWSAVVEGSPQLFP
jgi:hypothetical protein